MLGKKKEGAGVVRPKAAKGGQMSSISEMDRDIVIYRMLASGASTKEYLFTTYRRVVLKIKDHNLAENSDLAKKTGKAAFIRRLWLLKNRGYLDSRRYQARNNKGHYVLYVLSEASEAILCQDSGFEQETIRRTLPSPTHVAHDLQVTDVVRAIKREGLGVPYEYIINDEEWQRKTAQKKKQPFSDLFVTVWINIKGRVQKGEINLEVDNNTIAPLFVKEKVRKMVHPTIILCTVSKRIDNLRNFFKQAYDDANSDINPDKNLKKVFFAFTSDFCASSGGGFLNTKIENIVGGRSEVFKL